MLEEQASERVRATMGNGITVTHANSDGVDDVVVVVDAAVAVTNKEEL